MMPFILFSVFTAVTLLTITAFYPVLARRSVIQQRLDKLVTVGPEKPASLFTEKTAWQSFLERLGNRIHFKKREESKYTKTLVAAGLRKESFPVFIGVKLFLSILFPTLFALIYALPKGILLRFDSLMYIAILSIAGYLLPSIWLTRRVSHRKTEIFHTLPDVLDLLTICVESGLALDSALIRVCDNPHFKKNPLADELRKTGMETRAGKPRSEAMKDMAERTLVTDIRSFVLMLTQSERFGTSLGVSLRVHSDSLRSKRRQIAEEAAAKTAIKLLFPLAFFVFPALLVVVLGPLIFKLELLFK